MIWCRGACSRNIRGVTPLSTWVQGSSGDMAVQRAETPSVCGERSSAHEKQSPPSPVSLDLSSSALALQLARNEWARITVFGTSRVQSGLRLDRQLETSSARCQTPWEGGGASERNVLFPPPPAAGFRETVGSRLGPKPQIRGAVSLPCPPACPWQLCLGRGRSDGYGDRSP